MDLRQNLNNYLSSKTKNGASSNLENSEQSTSLLGWFQKNEQNEDDDIGNDTANGWFAKAQSDPCLPSLSKKHRIIGFFGCLLMGTFCFSLASLYIPFLLVKARKFAMLYTLGSLFVILSFSLLWGPMNHIKHLCSVQRLPFTLAYFGTMFTTIYVSIWLKSTVLTIVFAVAQILTLVWYIVSYIPGGQTGLNFFSKLFYSAASKTVSKAMPV